MLSSRFVLFLLSLTAVTSATHAAGSRSVFPEPPTLDSPVVGQSIRPLLMRALQAAPANSSASVQAGARRADAVTGKWGEDTVTFLELVHDGKGSVSGVAIFRNGRSYLHRAAIRTGSYNSNTRAVLLEGDGVLPDGTPATYTFVGTIAADTLAGRFRFGDERGGFRGRFSYTRR